MQLPAMQACPCGQTTPLQGSLHRPLMHLEPVGQATPTHAGSTQRPLSGSHTSIPSQTNSPPPHLGTQLPLSHTWFAGQMSPSSTAPLQSLSKPSHVSLEGPTRGMHWRAPLWHWSVPSPQTPGLPVAHFPPPPAHEMPVTKVVRSSKSLSPPDSRSSHPK